MPKPNLEAQLKPRTRRKALILARNRGITVDRLMDILLDAKMGRPITVTLDALASQLVFWYASEITKDPVDLINGMVAGQLLHVRDKTESGSMDDSASFIAEYVQEAVNRRELAEAKAR